jgi:protein involved in polysaccharide export with SLBB domain
VIAHEGERLSMVIARAGTSQNSTADLNHVTVTRKTTDGTAQTHQVDLYKILKQGDLSQDMLMEKGDLVFVPTANHKDTVSGPASIFNVLRVLLGLP